MSFFLFYQAIKQHLPENIWLKIEVKCQSAGMITSFFCHKAQSTFILFICFAEDGLSLRVIHKTADIHPCRFSILKHIPMAATYARQKVFHFIDRLYTDVPEMAKLQMEHRITQGFYINIIVPRHG